MLGLIDIVAKLLGDENYREGMTTIFEALQHPELNQHVSDNLVYLCRHDELSCLLFCSYSSFY